MNIIDITNADGQIVAPEWLPRMQDVHRQLRPKLKDYAAEIKRVCRTGGRLCAAAVDNKVVGVALYRIYESTYDGRRMYVDDLVTDDAHRSQGVGAALLAHMQAIARDAGCDTFALDSGTHREQAHKFYFREGLTITSFSFRKHLAAKTQ